MAEGPLTGRRVIELAGIGPGPFAAMTLADLGAEVVRVDRPGGSFFPGKEHVDVLNRGKKSVLLDLRRPEAVRTVHALVERADVLIEGYRPGVAERLGVGPEDCLARNPSLVYGRMTGWGQDGPLAHLAGHDISYIALTGALHAIGEAGGPPRIPLNLVGDFGGGGAYLVIGILAALDEARRSGRGQVVDAAIVDGTAHLLAGTHMMLAGGGWDDRRGVNLLDGGAPFYSVYETADGRHMAVGALERKFYIELIGKLELDEDPDQQNERAHWPELRRRIADAFKHRTQAEWSQVFAQSDACVAPVLTLREAVEHPHIKARGSIVDRDGLLQPAPAPRFSRTPTTLGSSPPSPGQDTDEVLDSWGVGGHEVSAGVPGAKEMLFAPVEETGELKERRAAVAELGAELRSLVGLATCTEVPTNVLREAARHARELAPMLRDRGRPVTEAATVDDLVRGVRMFNPVIGEGNPIALPLRVEEVANGVVAWCELGRQYEGPHMYGHGGVSALLLDQVLGHAAASVGNVGVTRELTTRYHRPVPLEAPLRIWGRVEEVDGRRTKVVGGVTTTADPDLQLVEAAAWFVALRPEQAHEMFAASTSTGADLPGTAHD